MSERMADPQEVAWMLHFSPHRSPVEITSELLRTAGENALFTAITADWIRVWIDGGYTITDAGRAALARYREMSGRTMSAGVQTYLGELNRRWPHGWMPSTDDEALSSIGPLEDAETAGLARFIEEGDGWYITAFGRAALAAYREAHPERD